MRVGVQADDLTGACDTGCVFAARGLETVVLLPDAPLPSPSPAVLVLDTESRHRDASEARKDALAAATRLAACGPGLVYKKLDSTLRGPIAAELAGVLEGVGTARAVVAPAFPGQHRTVLDGCLRIGQRPAAETPIARDPAFPPTGDSVLALLAAAGPRPIALLPLATVRRGASAVAARIARHAGSLVCDAETEADLAIVAAAAGTLPVLLAGSAGLADAVAARLAPASHRPVPAPRSPLLVVAGSRHPTTRAQLGRLDAQGIAGIRASDLAGDREGDRAAVLCALAAATRERLERGLPGTLLLTGGETAYSVCRAIGATGIALDGEFERGLAMGRLLGGPFAGLTVVTKAGGFGDPETLLRLHDACT
jgi:D-threonate/D-erythronate kinase